MPVALKSYHYRQRRTPISSPRFRWIFVCGLWAFAIFTWTDISAAPAQEMRTESGILERLKSENELLKSDVDFFRNYANEMKAQNEALRKHIGSLDPLLYAKYIETKRKEFDFQSEMMSVNSYNFQHQRIASYVILALVVCVVLAGVWFAHVQLMAGLRPVLPGLSSDTQHSPVVSGSALATTSIEASLQKVTVTSSVVGIIVLFISLAFLYIYTREVYTIKMIDPYKPLISSDRKSGSAGSKQSDTDSAR